VTREILATALPRECLIASAENLGYAGGNNLGIRRAIEASCKYVLLLNTDAEISLSNARRLIERLKTYPELSIIGPVIRELDDRRVQYLVGGRDIARYALTRAVIAPGEIKSLKDYPLKGVDYVSGTVLLARTDMLNEIGVFDEQYFFSGETADLCKRAKDKGYKIVVDLETYAQHDTRQTPPRMREILYAYYGLRNRFLYVKKHCVQQRLIYFSYWSMIGAIGLCRALLNGRGGKARAIVLALIHAYRGHFGNQNANFL
jgi:GT2 family glycosyltransferase